MPAAGIRTVRTLEDALGLLTVENNEVAYGLDDLLPLTSVLPIVLDLLHHWIHSGREHILPADGAWIECARAGATCAWWRTLARLGAR